MIQIFIYYLQKVQPFLITTKYSYYFSAFIKSKKKSQNKRDLCTNYSHTTYFKYLKAKQKFQHQAYKRKKERKKKKGNTSQFEPVKLQVVWLEVTIV